MVSTQLVVAAAGAVVTSKLVKRLPAFHSDPRIDAGIKAAVGLGAVVLSVKVKNEWAKAALIAAGTGMAASAAGNFVPFLA